MLPGAAQASMTSCPGLGSRACAGMQEALDCMHNTLSAEVTLLPGLEGGVSGMNYSYIISDLYVPNPGQKIRHSLAFKPIESFD